MPSKTRELQGYDLNGQPITLQDICASLHANNMGMSDPMTRDQLEHFMGILKLAILNWETSLDESKDYDDAVLNLVKVTMIETFIRNSYKD